MAQRVPVTVAHGDGIGPEIMTATLHVLDAAGARIDIETIEIGEAVYRRGQRTGIEPSAWDSLRRTKVFLKAPITTPQGGGFASLNVTVRKSMGLYANVRPCLAYHPLIRTKHPGMDVVIVRENEEDLYAGIEHRQTDEVVQCLKLISRPGCEKICRYAFEYARRNNRKKVTCFTKDNIMKMTDGLFHRTFDRVGALYPDIQKEHWIVDIGAAKLADTPEAFDVLVMPNLYGDILSDVAAQISGSVGLAGSSNIGEHGAMFEAIHGSAPRRAGQDVANPSGLLLGAVMMLVHIDQGDVAERVHNAWLATLEDGLHTYDVYDEATSKRRVGTKEFAQAIVDRLGREPGSFKPVRYPTDRAAASSAPPLPALAPAKKALVGADVFFDWPGRSASELAERLKPADGDGLALSMITNRGVRVWPDGLTETFCTDHWRARYRAAPGPIVTHAQLAALLTRLVGTGLDFIKVENLCTFDGEPGFSTGQGE
jgi:isocitrate dehydrogenase